MPRIVITGLGLVIANGIMLKMRDALMNGKDGTAELKSFDTSQYKVHRACEVKDFKLDTVLKTKPPQTRYTNIHTVAKEALKDSGLSDITGYETEKDWYRSWEPLPANCHLLNTCCAKSARGEG